MNNFIVTVGDKIAGYNTVTCYGSLIVPSVGAGSIIKDWFARFTDFFGGRSKSYEKTFESLIATGLDSMVQQAKSVGANAILNLRIESTNISGKSIIGMLLYGTAVKIEQDK